RCRCRSGRRRRGRSRRRRLHLAGRWRLVLRDRRSAEREGTDQREGHEDYFHWHLRYSASAPVSPVRMRTTCSRLKTKILPSPILPVLAAAVMASMVLSTWSVATATSILIF